MKNVLVAAIDADTRTVAQRMRDFDDVCKEIGLEPRQRDERVMYVVPRRNIETWLAFLAGENVDEDHEYPRLEFERDCQQGVERLDELCGKRDLGPGASPSLQAACDEYNRLARLMA
jgi:hypothetical protein